MDKVPLEVTDMILGYNDPLNLLSLCYTNKYYYNLCKNSRRFWKGIKNAIDEYIKLNTFTEETKILKNISKYIKRGILREKEAVLGMTRILGYIYYSLNKTEFYLMIKRGNDNNYSEMNANIFPFSIHTYWEYTIPDKDYDTIKNIIDTLFIENIQTRRISKNTVYYVFSVNPITPPRTPPAEQH